MTKGMREVVDGAIRRDCEYRQLQLDALNVRTNHVHVLIGMQHVTSGDDAMNRFKAYATRALREADLIGDRKKVWVRHGSTQYLFDPWEVESARDYVQNHQD